jgi:GT2 family glycosyltransferase
MKLLVVILCYKVPELTIDCLRSLSEEVGRVPGTRVAVCENGTGGDAAEQIRRAIDENGWGGWVDLTVLPVNLGFTGGNNVVVREALASGDPPQYVLLLNADTTVEPGSLGALVDFLDAHPQVGIAASQLLAPEGGILPSPFRFMSVATELDRGLRFGLLTKLVPRCAIAPPTPREPCRADWVCGASVALRSTMLEQIGLLDEGLYTYFDDIDICLRAWRAGWEVWYVPESRVVHLEGASTELGRRGVKRRPAYWHQARRRFFLKSYGAAYTALADAVFILGFASWQVRRRLQRKPDTEPPYLLLDSVRHSVFLTGFTVREVENPALRTQQAAGAAAPSLSGAVP